MHVIVWQLLLLSARVLGTRGLTGARGLLGARGLTGAKALLGARGLTGARGLAEAQDRNLIQVGTGGHRFLLIIICV